MYIKKMRDLGLRPDGMYCTAFDFDNGITSYSMSPGDSSVALRMTFDRLHLLKKGVSEQEIDRVGLVKVPAFIP